MSDVSEAVEVQAIAQIVWKAIGPAITAARAADIARDIHAAMHRASVPDDGDLFDAAFKARWFVDRAARGAELTEIGKANAKDVLTLLDAALKARKG